MEVTAAAVVVVVAAAAPPAAAVVCVCAPGEGRAGSVGPYTKHG